MGGAVDNVPDWLADLDDKSSMNNFGGSGDHGQFLINMLACKTEFLLLADDLLTTN